jgi:hypothetical protein
MRSADDEKAQIVAIIPSLSRMHQLSALPAAASMGEKRRYRAYIHPCLIFAAACDHAAAA